MTVVGCQLMAGLLSLPFYILLFPYGAIVHALFGSVGVGYAFAAVSDDFWETFIDRLNRYTYENLLRILISLAVIWFIVPVLVCIGLRMLDPEVSIGIAGEITALLEASIFPSSLSDYENAFARSLGPASAARYVIGMFLIASIIPFSLGISSPAFLVFWVFRLLQMRRRKERAAKLGAFYWPALMMFLVAVAAFYIVEFKYSHDVGYIEPRESHEAVPFCFFLVQTGSLLVATGWAHFGLSVALSRRVVPQVVEEYLSKDHPTNSRRIEERTNGPSRSD